MLFFGCSQELVVDPPTLPEPMVHEIHKGDEISKLYYDAANHLSRVVRTYLGEVVLVQLYKHNSNGQLLSFERFNPHSLSYQEYQTDWYLEEYIYEEDMLSKIMRYDFDQFDQKQLVHRSENFKFYNDNLISYQLYYPALGYEDRPLALVEMEYDNGGNLISATTSTVDKQGRKVAVISKDRYSYDDERNPLKDSHYEGMLSQWSLSYRNFTGERKGGSDTSIERELEVVNGYPLTFIERKFKVRTNEQISEVQGNYFYDYQQTKAPVNF